MKMLRGVRTFSWVRLLTTGLAALALIVVGAITAPIARADCVRLPADDRERVALAAEQAGVIVLGTVTAVANVAAPAGGADQIVTVRVDRALKNAESGQSITVKTQGNSIMRTFTVGTRYFVAARPAIKGETTAGATLYRDDICTPTVPLSEVGADFDAVLDEQFGAAPHATPAAAPAATDDSGVRPVLIVGVAVGVVALIGGSAWLLGRRRPSDRS